MLTPLNYSLTIWLKYIKSDDVTVATTRVRNSTLRPATGVLRLNLLFSHINIKCDC